MVEKQEAEGRRKKPEGVLSGGREILIFNAKKPQKAYLGQSFY